MKEVCSILDWSATYFRQWNHRLSVDACSQYKNAIWNIDLTKDNRWRVFLSGIIGESVFDQLGDAIEFCEAAEKSIRQVGESAFVNMYKKGNRK